MSAATVDEAYGLARAVIQEFVPYDPTIASRYIAQFPEILTMELVGGSVSDSIEQGLRRAVFGRIESDIRSAVLAQFAEYDLDDLTRAVSNGIAVFERYLANDLFAPIRIRPSKVLSCLSAVIDQTGDNELKQLMGQLGNMVSEMKTKASEARHSARVLREASQYCSLLLSGELLVETEIVPTGGYALAG
jgi:uncharacterized protein YqeY